VDNLVRTWEIRGNENRDTKETCWQYLGLLLHCTELSTMQNPPAGNILAKGGQDKRRASKRRPRFQSLGKRRQKAISWPPFAL